MKNRNTWTARIKRTLTSLLPVANNRTGKCLNCGECCKLPNICPFLRYRKNGKSYCAIYYIRSFNCRKYPRTKKEFITRTKCGYRFK